MGDGPGVSGIEGLPSWDLKGLEGITAPHQPAGRPPCLAFLGHPRLSGGSPDPPFCPSCPPGAEATRLPSPLPTVEEPPVLCGHPDPAEQPLSAVPRGPAPGCLPAGPLPRPLQHHHLQAAVCRGGLLPPARKYVETAASHPLPPTP